MMDLRHVAEVANALSDEGRLKILTVLLEGGASVSELVERLGMSQPNVSGHLAVLREAGLTSAERVGRQRIYRVEPDRIEAIMSAFSLLTPAFTRLRTLDPKAVREVRRNSPIRRTRTCYDHLAGLAGVTLLDALLERRWLEVEQDHKRRPLYQLTPKGEQALANRGVDVEKAQRARRMFAYGCLDWTERRPHLGGALGAEVLRALEGTGFVRREAEPRVVTLSKPVAHWVEGRENSTGTTSDQTLSPVS
jgi:DNA-binding transcriptional ArsR family regulator